MQPLVKQRIHSIDLLRGIIMIVMALDHVRDFFQSGGPAGPDPTSMATTTPLLFFTRFITHYCAPTFVFLSGVSAFLSGQRKTKKELSAFLLKRGIWLLLVEVIFISFGLSLNPAWGFVLLQVIWAIGWSMIILAAFIRLPLRTIFITGLVIVLFHNLLDYVTTTPGTISDVLLKITFTSGGFPLFAGGRLFVFAYAIIPWTGIMLLGYATGSLYQASFNDRRRKKILFTAGAAALLAFVVLRSINHYGDPAPWAVQRNGVYTFLSFMNISKYPPSLMYVCITLGPSLLFLSLTENAAGKLVNVLSTYGRVPFFYYICHFYLLRFFSIISFFLQGFTLAQVHSQPFFFEPPRGGYNLGIVYLVWLLVVSLLYFPCRWFDQYKKSHREKWWLSYV